jgi:uncharacterized BrkB/YihY/UPF0761 family membrane protein
MQTSKTASVSRGLCIILAITLCIGLGTLTGFYGGLHNEVGAAYHSSNGSQTIAGGEVIRLYGAFVLLAILGVIALATLALSVGGIFPPRRKHNHSD